MARHGEEVVLVCELVGNVDCKLKLVGTFFFVLFLTSKARTILCAAQICGLGSHNEPEFELLNVSFVI